MILDSLARVMSANGLITAFVFVGGLVWFSYWISAKLTRGQVHGSAIAIMLGLVLAWWGGLVTGGDRGLSDISLLAGVGTLGGAMFRDFAIVATAFGADVGALKKAGVVGTISIVIGVVLSFFVGVVVAVLFGYTDPVAVTTIGAGAATYIVGPVTGTALGASSEIIALSVAAGLTKSVLVMVHFIPSNNSAKALGSLTPSPEISKYFLLPNNPPELSFMKLVSYNVSSKNTRVGYSPRASPTILIASS